MIYRDIPKLRDTINASVQVTRSTMPDFVGNQKNKVDGL
jgi:hypothetical protein